MKINDTQEAVANRLGVDISPSLELSSSNLADIKKWNIGDTYALKLEVRMTSLSEDYSDKTKMRGSFKVTKVESLGETNEASETDNGTADQDD